jgi:hypothetical protein
MSGVGNLNDNAGVPQAAVGYFVDQKKGEVNELKTVSVTVAFSCLKQNKVYERTTNIYLFYF